MASSGGGGGGAGAGGGGGGGERYNSCCFMRASFTEYRSSARSHQLEPGCKDREAGAVASMIACWQSRCRHSITTITNRIHTQGFNVHLSSHHWCQNNYAAASMKARMHARTHTCTHTLAVVCSEYCEHCDCMWLHGCIASNSAIQSSK